MSASAFEIALSNTIASATPEAINAELAKRGWRLAYDPSAQQGESLPPMEDRLPVDQLTPSEMDLEIAYGRGYEAALIQQRESRGKSVSTEPPPAPALPLTKDEEEHALSLLRGSLGIEDRLRRLETLTLYDDPLTHELVQGLNRLKREKR